MERLIVYCTMQGHLRYCRLIWQLKRSNIKASKEPTGYILAGYMEHQAAQILENIYHLHSSVALNFISQCIIP